MHALMRYSGRERCVPCLTLRSGWPDSTSILPDRKRIDAGGLAYYKQNARTAASQISSANALPSYVAHLGNIGSFRTRIRLSSMITIAPCSSSGRNLARASSSRRFTSDALRFRVRNRIMLGVVVLRCARMAGKSRSKQIIIRSSFDATFTISVSAALGCKTCCIPVAS